jgi:hypothetical protein
VMWAIVHTNILDRIPAGNAAPYSWICILVASALIAVAAEVSALRIFFKQRLRRAVVGLLLAIELCCAAGAGYVTFRYVRTHPTLEWRNIWFQRVP